MCLRRLEREIYSDREVDQYLPYNVFSDLLLVVFDFVQGFLETWRRIRIVEVVQSKIVD